MSKICVSHCDLDGLLPNVINDVYSLGYDKIINTNYDDDKEHETLSTLSSEDEVVYVDFTPNEKAIEIIKSVGCKVVIIDHHESQVDTINNFIKEYNKAEYIYDVNECGTSLYYKYVTEKLGKERNVVLEEEVELTKTYDLWKQESPIWTKAENLNRLMWQTCNWANKDDFVALHKFFIDSLVWKCQNTNKFSFNKLETQKIEGDIRKEKEQFETLISDPKNFKTRKDSQDRYFALFKCNKKISAMASLVLKKYSKLEYVIVVNEYEVDNPKLSVRSRELNLLNFVECKGHENACGVENVTKEYIDDLWGNKIHSLTYREVIE